MNVDSAPMKAETQASRSILPGWFWKRRWFLLFVVLPTLLSAFYYALIASSIFISESRFVIKSPDQKQAQMSSLANFIQTTGLSSGQEQTNEILAYIHSRDALKALDQSPDLRTRFESPQADFLARFPRPFMHNSFENLYKYYCGMVDARLDTETGTAVITVKAFTAKDAHDINERLLELSEDMVNRLNARARTRGITEALKQVDIASARAKAARLALANYRNAQQIIDPSLQAAGVLDITNTLTSQRTALQAQLDLMQRLTPQNPSIPTLQSRIAAISSQIAEQNSRLVGSGKGLASKMGNYEKLVVEQEFATQNLNVANAALVQARTEALRQQFYLERIVDPNLPDMPLLPKRFLSVLVVAAAASCLYFVGWMLIVGILEHAPDE